jgi:asparagine synthase (glutamine-hydrolysing)
MCGIAGILRGDFETFNIGETVRSMTSTLVHRGPDDVGVWRDEREAVALGHRRLSIIDLSPLGHQPMESSSGRYVIVYNGEIYNFKELRAEFEAAGSTFRGGSDTEVILEAVERLGLRGALDRIRGMFAFALWDKRERLLFLARDRIGEKPLYYGRVKGGIAFASELKAIRACPGFDAEVDRNALTLYMRHNYVPAPYSIYRNVFKLQPGTFIVLKASSPQSLPEPNTYWSACDVAQEGVRHALEMDEAQATDQLDALLRLSVRDQMVADVPLGAFLSGGIDSSTVVAMMQAQSNRPVRTFTIGFHEAEFNEADMAKQVATHLGTEHTELYVTPQDAMAVIPRLPDIFDEPFADSSQIPTCLVSMLTRQTVTVSLSGDGGDELFGGYQRYAYTADMSGGAGQGGGLLARCLSSARQPRLAASIRKVRSLMAEVAGTGRLTERLDGLARMMSARDPDTIYMGVLSHWTAPETIVLGGIEPPSWITSSDPRTRFADFRNRMMLLDTVAYLPDDILVKVDRAAMGVSLETRVPLLDRRVVEFAWSLPITLKIRDGVGKWILRRVLERYLPKAMFDRPKMGFGVPIGEWLRGPLREWAESLLEESRLRREGFLEPQQVRRKWIEHVNGTVNWQYPLWDVLVFQAWLDRWMRG